MERNLLITWYESENNDGEPSDLFLQINEYPMGHPECTGWSWKRIRNEQLPYQVVYADN